MKSLLFLFPIFLMSSCSSFDIYNADHTKIKGIPFFAMKGVKIQTTTYTRTWLEANLEYHQLKGDGKMISGSSQSVQFFIAHQTFNKARLIENFVSAKEYLPGFYNMVEVFENGLTESCKNKINCLITHQTIIKESESSTVLPGNASLLQTLEANKVSIDVKPDYEHTFYFNTTIPPFGTSTAEIELSPDGTLKKASSIVDTKLSELIPLKEFLLDKLKIGEDDPPSPKMQKLGRTEVVSVTVSTAGYKYELSKEHPINTETNTKEQPIDAENSKFNPLNFGDDGISINRIKFAEISSSNNSEQEQSGKSIIIDGTITLPE